MPLCSDVRGSIFLDFQVLGFYFDAVRTRGDGASLKWSLKTAGKVNGHREFLAVRLFYLLIRLKAKRLSVL